MYKRGPTRACNVRRAVRTVPSYASWQPQARGDRSVTAEDMARKLELVQAQYDGLRLAAGRVVANVRRVGGFMAHLDQVDLAELETLLAEARR